MAEFKDADGEDFELELEGEEEEVKPQKAKKEVEIEEIDDTPPEDRGREPMPKEIVDELEADELEEYSEKVKLRLKQLKKVWHDERRERERVQREHNEAIAAAQRILDENRRLNSVLSQGEETLVGTAKRAAELEVEQARRMYREAHDADDIDKLVEAQEALNLANTRLEQIKSYKPTLQQQEVPVQTYQEQPSVPRPDTKTLAWQERNQWYGTDPEMTASALGLHQRLHNERGPEFIGSDEYWSVVDKTMRKRFPEYFGDSEETAEPKAKKPNVVAPATRSTSPKKIRLTKSQLAVAKKFGLTPEQYAREMVKLDS